MTTSLQRRAQRVRVVILDVDGVLTDGRLYYGADGEACKAFDVRDGLGIRLLQQAGIRIAILSGRSSAAVATRARELGIDTVLQGRADKLAGLHEVLAVLGAEAGQCAFVGDDWPDLPVLAQVGLAATVADADDAVRAVAHWIAPARGGRGAVRQLAEFLLRAQGHYDALLSGAAAGAAGAVDHGAGAAGA